MNQENIKMSSSTLENNEIDDSKEIHIKQGEKVYMYKYIGNKEECFSMGYILHDLARLQEIYNSIDEIGLTFAKERVLQIKNIQKDITLDVLTHINFPESGKENERWKLLGSKIIKDEEFAEDFQKVVFDGKVLNLTNI